MLRPIPSRVPFVLLLLSFLLCCGCGSDDDPAAPDDETATLRLFGRLMTDSFAPEQAAEGDLWVVAVDAAGAAADRDRVVPGTGLDEPFDLELAVDRDYVVEIRNDAVDGPTAAILLIKTETSERAVFRLPADGGDVDLGRLKRATGSDWAVSDRGADLDPLLPASPEDYRDLDGDRVPDAFDRDDDDDGLLDPDDPVSDLVRFAMDGGILLIDSDCGEWRANGFWLAGLRDDFDATLSLDPSAAPRLDLALDLDAQLLLGGVHVLAEPSAVVFDSADALVRGTLRIGRTGWVKLTPVASVEGHLVYGYVVEYSGLTPESGTLHLTCEEFASVPAALQSCEPHVALAWAGYRPTAAAAALVREVMAAFEWCMDNKQDLLDQREFHGLDVTVLAEPFPGDGSQGHAVYGWIDEDDNPSINPGDSFTAVFENNWRPRPDGPGGVLIDGRIEIHRYIDRRDLPGRILLGAEWVEARGLTLTPTEYVREQHVALPDAAVTIDSYRYDMQEGGPAFWIEY